MICDFIFNKTVETILNNVKIKNKRPFWELSHIICYSGDKAVAMVLLKYGIVRFINDQRVWYIENRDMDLYKVVYEEELMLYGGSCVYHYNDGKILDTRK